MCFDWVKDEGRTDDAAVGGVVPRPLAWAEDWLRLWRGISQNQRISNFFC
jgi:hypothetical protein